MYRRAGFPEAEAAPQYCIDELGSDNFYTYTVSVYVGKRDETTIPAGLRRALKSALARLNR